MAVFLGPCSFSFTKTNNAKKINDKQMNDELDEAISHRKNTFHHLALHLSINCQFKGKIQIIVYL